MNKKLKKLAAMMMALMMIALVGITASAQTEETEEQMFFGSGWDMIHRITGDPVVQDEGVPGDSLDEEQLIVRIKPPRP